jgi:alpha/beta superfamily hydrolase
VITTADGVRLEVAWTEPTTPAVGCVVLCHPHPLDGGTMNAPLVRTIAKTMADAGLRVLRFNFRGVGESQGTWGGGMGEVTDVAAAVEAAAASRPGLPQGVAGWSFGATTSLRWQAETGSTLPWVGIAPGIRSYREASLPVVADLAPARRLVVHGDRDQFATAAEMTEYASSIGARIELLPGSDHFFFYRERRVGALAAAHFGGTPIEDVASQPAGGR